MFPALSAGKPSYWMGFRPSTPDSLPILGEAPRGPACISRWGTAISA